MALAVSCAVVGAHARTSITALDATLPARPGTVLPAYVAPAAPLLGDTAVVVDRVELVGNTILGDELAVVAARYSGRRLTAAELRELQDALTLVYVQRGYVTSGARLDSITDAVLRVEIVEGRLEQIRVQSDHYRPAYLAGYLESFGALEPLNAYDIERRLQALQNEPRVERVDAQLLPSAQRGDAILAVTTRESPPLSASIEANNYQTPAVGAWTAQGRVNYYNAVGRGDRFELSARDSEGLWELFSQYGVPVDASGTRVELYGSAQHSKIVSGPFRDLDIKADWETGGLRLVEPLSRDPADLVSVSVTGEWWRSKTYLLGSGFSFVEGPDDGVAEATVIRLGADWRHRTARSVFAASWIVSIGLDAFGATQSHGDVPGGQFVSTALRSQWAQRLGWLDSQLIARFDAQLADRPLLGMEQMTLGGRWTIRGYRENTLIRDNGVIGSLEWRVPLWTDANGRVVVEVGPFVDLSYSWNTDRGEIGPKKLNSAGLGLNWRPLDRVHCEVYWGAQLEDVDYPGHDQLQDAGVHIGVEVQTR
jgi:hemolysin activation/secretion protein